MRARCASCAVCLCGLWVLPSYYTFGEVLRRERHHQPGVVHVPQRDVPPPRHQLHTHATSQRSPHMRFMGPAHQWACAARHHYGPQ
jgi:hypothetical protein